MKILKKGGVVEERGRRKRNPCPMRLWPNPPDHVIKQLQDIFSLLWDGNIAKVKRLTVTGNYAERGGR